MASPLHAIVEEQGRRSIRSTQVPIITLNSTRGGKALAAGMPGSAHVILARKGSGAIEKVREALESSEDHFKQAINDIIRPLRRKRPAPSLEAMVKLTVKQPVFAELRSGGERLHSGIFVPPGADAIPITYPYNGGPLPSRGLVLVEYVADGAGEAALEAVVLKCDPKLTKAEAAAVRLMPKDQIARNIGVALDCDTTWAMVAVAAVAVAVATGTLAIALVTGTCQRIGDPHMTEDIISQLGPGASARRLLELRRQALIKAAKALAKGG